MQRRATVELRASAVKAAALARAALGLDADLTRPQGTEPLDLRVEIEPIPPRANATGSVAHRAAEGSGDRGDTRTAATVVVEPVLTIPFFGWFFRPVLARAARRIARHAAAALTAADRGVDPPPPPKPSALLPSVGFSQAQVTLIAAVCLCAAIVSFGSALFGQNVDTISHTYHVSNAAIGVSLAVTRVGVLCALVAVALADRRGRRVILLASVVGVCAANAVSAVAPTIEVFTAAQLVVRAFVNSAVVVGGIAAIEEAPEGARAFAAAMLALASGAGYAVSVVLLPLADLGRDAWRLSFVVSALSIVAVPMIARALKETSRYELLAARTHHRGRFREVFHPEWGRRFWLLAGVGFLANVFSAPSAQLTNKYLSDVHHYSSSGIAAFRTITNGVPGLLGLVIGGRLAETRGRRPVAIVGVVGGTALTMIFFLGGGALLWIMSTLSILAAAGGTVAVGTLDAELFPTEVRGSGNALLLVASVLGSAAGLLLAGGLAGPLGGLGHSIAICGVASLAAGIFLVPRLPESVNRTLDDVSPSEL